MSLTVTVFCAGGWWQIDKFDDITGPVSIEIGSMQYLQAQDNGLFLVGPQHDIGTDSGVVNTLNLLHAMLYCQDIPCIYTDFSLKCTHERVIRLMCQQESVI